MLARRPILALIAAIALAAFVKLITAWVMQQMRRDALAQAQARPTTSRCSSSATRSEVTLLPRHCEWLGVQPGGASVVLRRLVDEARHASEAKGLTTPSRSSSAELTGTATRNTSSSRSAPRSPVIRDEPKKTAQAGKREREVGEFIANDRYMMRVLLGHAAKPVYLPHRTKPIG